MFEWIISSKGVAYLDLRREELTFGEAERLLEVIQPYYPGRQLDRILIDVRGLDPLPGAVQVLLVGIDAQALAAGVAVEVMKGDPPLS
jgi:hypothetical protein